MNIIKTSDWHLTDGKDDGYKFDFFPWLKQQIIEHRIDRVDFLGDLTEKKDKHCSDLLNRITDEIIGIAKLCPVVILKGNHDYVDSDTPFFHFLRHIPNITYVSEPTVIDGELFLPHAKDPEEGWDWKKLSRRLRKIHTLNLHQTLIGSKVPNGHTLEHGISFDLFKGFDGDIYSGDIHMPQEVKGVTFVGTPYPVYFGDHFEGRVLLLKDFEESELNYPCLCKHSIKIAHPYELKDIDLYEGDQAKITLELHPSDSSKWPEYRKDIQQYLEEVGVHLFGIQLTIEKVNNKRERKRRNADRINKAEAPEKILNRFVKKEELSKQHLKVAEGLMDFDVGI